MDEAEDFLEDCMADVVDTIDDVRDYLEDMGMDTHGMTDEELENASEIFPLPSGKYLFFKNINTGYIFFTLSMSVVVSLTNFLSSFISK